MIHGGVFLIRYPVVVVVGPGPPGPQTSVVVADVEGQDQEQAQHADRPCDHGCQGHGSQGLALGGGDCGNTADLQGRTGGTMATGPPSSHFQAFVSGGNSLRSLT